MTSEARTWQRDAWTYYGMPHGSERSGEHALTQSIGELRYGVGWIATQTSRLRWRVLLDGEEQDPDESEELVGKVGATPLQTQMIVTNLVVAGEFDYIAQTDDRGRDVWRVVSVVHRDRRKMNREAQHSFRALWPHPADPIQPDPPVRGVLDILGEIELLQAQSRSQSRHRIASSGVLAYANEFETPDGVDFSERFEEAVKSAMVDPSTAAVPIMIKGPSELLGGSGVAGGNATGLHWLSVDRPYDARIDARLQYAVQRLAFGLPIPPEIILGMTATNRATAFQIEDAGYRAHIEPIGRLAGDVYAAALQLVLDDDRVVEVIPDATDLLARRHSVADVIDAWDRGLVSAAYVREVLGISEDDAAGRDDLELLAFTRELVASPPRSADPASEAVQGAADLDEANLQDLAGQLSDIDFALRSEASGAAAQAIRRARDRVGAKIRTRSRNDKQVRAQIDGVPDGEVVATLDRQALDGIDVEATVAEALDGLGQWWIDRLGEAARTVVELVGEVPGAEWQRWAAASAVRLVDGIAGQTIESLEAPDAPTPSQTVLRDALAIAGGEIDGAVVASPTFQQPGGFAVGVAVMRHLAAQGIRQSGWRWVYRPEVPRPTQQFPPHRDLAGTFHDEIPTLGGWSPGDHRGCLCAAQPVLRREAGTREGGRFAPQAALGP